MTAPVWLPALVELSAHGGNWDNYFNAVYRYFCEDFVTSTPVFRGKRLALKRHPVINDKEATFWHMISEGEEEAERLPDLRRCERIRWPRPFIERADTDAQLKVWTEPRGSDNRILIWCEAAEYLVVLSERKGYVLPWTAYPVERERQKEKLNKRWERSKA